MNLRSLTRFAAVALLVGSSFALLAGQRLGAKQDDHEEGEREH